jgi:curved DNA-binding protein CbpA
MADNSLPDYYNELNIDPQATTIEIKSAYRALAKQLHPDKTGSNDTSAFRRAHEAYEKLTDLSYRAEYDQAYRRARRRYRETENYAGPSRTAAYEAEEREEEERRLRRKSPPPYKPVRKPGEPGHSYFLGKAYQAWEKKDAAYKAKHPKWHAEQAE